MNLRRVGESLLVACSVGAAASQPDALAQAQTAGADPSTCVSWVQRAAGPQFSGHSGCWDSVRNEFIITYPCSLDTWAWDGTNWELRYDGSQNGAHYMTFDEARGVGVLFGGSCGYGEHTWEWDGTTWTMPTLSVEPSSFADATAITYDSARGQVLWYGEWLWVPHDPFCCVDFFPHLWAWDGGSQWVKIVDEGPLYLFPAFAFDSHRQVAVLFGGANIVDFADTWEWDGNSWTQRFPPVSPPPRIEHTMAFDSDRNVMVMAGGTSLSVYVFDDTWEYDGITWRQVAVRTPYPGVAAPLMAYDRVRKVMILHGGYLPNLPDSSPFTYELHRSSVTSGPDDSSAVVGSEANFEVAVQATSPATYQWRRNGQDLTNGGRISGATTDHLTISNVQPSDAVSYDVAVSTLCGPIESLSASLTVVGEAGATCTDGLDNDNDGFTDCADSECANEPACIALVPAVSTWGFIVLALSVMTAGSILVSRRREVAGLP